MREISTSYMAMTFDAEVGTRFSLDSIKDLHSGRVWWKRTLTGDPAVPDDGMLFEFARWVIDPSGAILHGPTRYSHIHLIVTKVKEESKGWRIEAESPEDLLRFAISISYKSRNDNAIRIRLKIRNRSRTDRVFLRLTLPRINGINRQHGELIGCVPRELGSVSRLWQIPPDREEIVLGARYDEVHGVPTAMNTMELASLSNLNGIGGVFFADVDSDLFDGIAPLQFNLAWDRVAGFWTADIPPSKSVDTPTLAIGVHAVDDWHAAVDYYVRANENATSLPDTPAWLREAGGIYGFSAGGAGSIYLAPDLPTIELTDGAAMATFERDNGPWTDGSTLPAPARFPVQIGPAGFAAAGSPLLAIKPIPDQVDVIAAGRNDALWVTWVRGASAWQDGRNGRWPKRITPENMAPPNALLAFEWQTDRRLDVFWAGQKDNQKDALWVTWKDNNGAWRDGRNGRDPARITPTNVAKPGGGVAAAKQNPNMLDVFWVNREGVICLTFVIDNGHWLDGVGSRNPIAVSPRGIADHGAPLAAIKRNDSELDVFVVDQEGDLWVTWEKNNGAWQDGIGERFPYKITNDPSFPRFAKHPIQTHLVAHRIDAHSIGVFGVSEHGAVIAVTVSRNGDWGAGLARVEEITPRASTAPGAHLAVAEQRPGEQLNVFFVGGQDAIWVTYRAGGVWHAPLRVSPAGFAPYGGGVATILRPGNQMEAYAIRRGLIQSFHDLPKLLDEANAVGTNVVYLWDYWEGSDKERFPPYFNKGDYTVRGDLGGASALMAGIEEVHRRRGRIIAYVEPFIVYRNSELAARVGAQWKGLSYTGGEYYNQHYSANYLIMPASLKAWQDHLIDICRRLVGEYGFDGIFLDSWAWQMNRRMKSAKDRGFPSQADWSKAVLTLTKRVREAIRRIDGDAVVLGETTAGPIARVWNGGLACDFWPAGHPTVPIEQLGEWRFNRAMMGERLIAAPARYAFQELNYFSNGLTLNELHQVFAAGYGLALWNNREAPAVFKNFVFENADHIRWLLDQRRLHKNALVYGRQQYQPTTTDPLVAAYFYRGSSKRIIVLVNTDPRNGRVVDVGLRATESDTHWRDAVIPGRITADGRLLRRLTIGPGDEENGIRILQRVRYVE